MSLDGAGAVTVTSDSSKGIQVTHIGPFTEGTHTLTIVNNGTASSRVSVVVDWVRETGLVFHKQGVPGASAQYMGSNAATAETVPGIPLATLGLVPTSSTALPEYSRAEDADPARNVKLAIMHLGINNQQAGASDNSAQVATAVTKFIKVARAAGADPLIVVPHFESAAQNQNAALYRAAIYTAANAQQAALVQFGFGPLGPSANWVSNGYVSPNLSNPHLNALGYDTQAQFLWDHVLSL